MGADRVPIERVEAAAYTIPTETPEADGTLEWNSTTLVTAEVTAGGRRGFGYSYTDASAAVLIADLLAAELIGIDAFDIPRAWGRMQRIVRNVGRSGIAAAAISAVDAALWDLEARLLDLPLARLLGMARDEIEVYASGGFTSYDLDQFREHLGTWQGEGIRSWKIKVGSDPANDEKRVAVARQQIGDSAALFVDANGAYDRKEALAFAERFAALGVSWFEEPVSSDDLDGLRLLRDRAPGGMEIAAGEYGYDSFYFRRMLERGAVDVLQADATRCAGITGLLKVGALCEAFSTPLSAHTAPTLHLAPGCSLPAMRHIEYFFDHVRIESMLFDGFITPRNGMLRPDPGRPGLGIELKRKDADRWRV